MSPPLLEFEDISWLDVMFATLIKDLGESYFTMFCLALKIITPADLAKTFS